MKNKGKHTYLLHAWIDTSAAKQTSLQIDNDTIKQRASHGHLSATKRRGFIIQFLLNASRRHFKLICFSRRAFTACHAVLQ